MISFIFVGEMLLESEMENWMMFGASITKKFIFGSNK